MKMFTIRKQVGNGSQAKVFLAEVIKSKKKSNPSVISSGGGNGSGSDSMYAIKVFNKEMLMRKDQFHQKQLMREIRV